MDIQKGLIMVIQKECQMIIDMRYEVYDKNYEVMTSFNNYIDALDFFNNNPCKFIYDTILNIVVEGNDK